jgi:hypothetical protein
MLRLLVAMLVLANLAFWAWSVGALESLGLAPRGERDPARLALQVHPEAVRVLPPSAPLAALSTAPAASASGPSTGPPLQCLEAGPIAPALLDAAERALVAAGLPDSLWVRTRQDVAAQLAVVLGPFSSRDALRSKREEIDRLRLPMEALDLPADGAGATPQPGLALGRYDSRAAADAGLAGFTQRGVRTARVMVLRPASIETRLRAESVTPEQAEQLRAVSAAVLGAGFAPCAVAAATR